MMVGHVLVNAAALVMLRDALIDGQIVAAFHILRMQADPDCRVTLSTGDHWTEWEAIAKHAPEPRID